MTSEHRQPCGHVKGQRTESCWKAWSPRSLRGGLRKKKSQDCFKKYNCVLYKQFKVPRKHAKTYINAISAFNPFQSHALAKREAACLFWSLMQISWAGLEIVFYFFVFLKRVFVCENKPSGHGRNAFACCSRASFLDSPAAHCVRYEPAGAGREKQLSRNFSWKDPGS